MTDLTEMSRRRHKVYSQQATQAGTTSHRRLADSRVTRPAQVKLIFVMITSLEVGEKAVMIRIVIMTDQIRCKRHNKYWYLFT